MKIDTSTIEGYATMTTEEKLAALEALELAEPDYSGYVKKSVFDKTASELSQVKKDRDARLSEDERAKQEREEELQRLRDRNAELERDNTIAKYKAQYLSMGYSEELASDTAKAWADADYDKVVKITEAAMKAKENDVKAGLLGNMKTPPVGGGSQGRTKEEILKIEDLDERMNAIAENLELFENI